MFHRSARKASHTFVIGTDDKNVSLAALAAQIDENIATLGGTLSAIESVEAEVLGPKETIAFLKLTVPGFNEDWYYDHKSKAFDAHMVVYPGQTKVQKLYDTGCCGKKKLRGRFPTPCEADLSSGYLCVDRVLGGDEVGLETYTTLTVVYLVDIGTSQ